MMNLCIVHTTNIRISIDKEFSSGTCPLRVGVSHLSSPRIYSLIMPLNDLSTLETLRTHKANSQDGKFLVPAILNVFKELKSNLDDCFDGLQSQLLDVIKQQEAQIAKLTTDNKELCRRVILHVTYSNT